MADQGGIPLSFFRSERAMKLRAEGRVEGAALAILRVLEGREIAVSESVRERIVGCSDLDTLNTWLGRSGTVAAAEELFVESVD
ncbi:hypothetical protein [Streptomyces sp. NPDC059063]|uniref:hypothetical protein n=1 Tax=unclassified Streptomyces TaxID=2593676 RepID=UPI0036D05152